MMARVKPFTIQNIHLDVSLKLDFWAAKLHPLKEEKLFAPSAQIHLFGRTTSRKGLFLKGSKPFSFLSEQINLGTVYSCVAINGINCHTSPVSLLENDHVNERIFTT